MSSNLMQWRLNNLTGTGIIQLHFDVALGFWEMISVRFCMSKQNRIAFFEPIL